MKQNIWIEKLDSDNLKFFSLKKKITQTDESITIIVADLFNSRQLIDLIG